MKFDEATSEFSVHKENVNYANGNTRDREGRLITCEHSVTRRVVRTEKDGSMTIWFTDPLFGINGEWEGSKAKPEQATTNVYRIATDGKLTAVVTDLMNPNGLAFSPDEKKLYVVEWKGTPNRSIWSFDVADDGSVSNKTKLIDADGPGALDGFRVDRDGNLWCGWGFTGAFAPEATEVPGGMKAHLPLAKSEDMDGVKVFNAQGKPIGFIRLPERCANLCFRRAEEQSALHDEQPFAVRALRRGAWGGLSAMPGVMTGPTRQIVRDGTSPQRRERPR